MDSHAHNGEGEHRETTRRHTKGRKGVVPPKVLLNIRNEVCRERSNNDAAKDREPCGSACKCPLLILRAASEESRLTKHGQTNNLEPVHRVEK